MKKNICALFFLLTATSLFAGEIEDLKKDLAVVQAEIRAELANLNAAQSELARVRVTGPAAQAEIERIQRVGPTLQAREKELVEKIKALDPATKSQGKGEAK